METYGGAVPVTTLRMRFACWITEATYTHSCCVILVAFLLQQWLRECVSVLRHTCVASLVVPLTYSVCVSVCYTRCARACVPFLSLPATDHCVAPADGGPLPQLCSVCPFTVSSCPPSSAHKTKNTATCVHFDTVQPTYFQIVVFYM